MDAFGFWDLMEWWPDPIDFGEVAVEGAEGEVEPPLPLEPEDIDFWTGMPLSVSYDLRRPD